MGEARCVRCILPASLPSAQLDENGLCRPCREYEARFGDWETVKEQRKQEFERLLSKVRLTNRPYDCLVPLSGGKDSTYSLYVCSEVYGMRCLCVTFDNGFLSEHARANIRHALEATGADHLMYTVSRDHLLKLYGLFLKKGGDFCSVCMRGITVCTQAARVAFDVPLVISGAGGRVSYLNMMPEVFQPGDEYFVRRVLEGESLRSDALALPVAAPSPKATALKLLRFARRGMNRAVRILEGEPVCYVVSIFSYLDVTPELMRQHLEQEMGWTGPSGDTEHMDCLVHEIPCYMRTRKFPRLTLNTFHRCGLVRRGLMTRNEALRAEEQELAAPKVPKALGPFLAELGMSEDEFNAYVQDWTKVSKFRRRG